VGAEPVGDAADAAAPADDAPAAPVKDDVDAPSREPASLVEAVGGTSWRSHSCPEGEDGALRRRAPERQLE
jgi:hypothetical protein